MVELELKLDGAAALARIVHRAGELEGRSELQLDEQPEQQLGERLEELGRMRLEVQKLAAADDLSPRNRVHRERLEARTDRILGELGAEFEALGPSQLRAVLGRHRLDQRSLLAVIGIHRLGAAPEPWTEARGDKLDLLISRLGQAVQGADGAELERLLEEMPAGEDRLALGAVELNSFKAWLKAFRAEAEKADSLEELVEQGTLERYRSVKHRLGRLLLYPQVLVEVSRTNGVLKRKMDRLFAVAEAAIITTFQGIFDIGLSRAMTAELREELEQLEGRFDRFESQVQAGNVKYAEAARLWSELRSFFDRIATLRESLPVEEPAAAAAITPGGQRAGSGVLDWLRPDLEVLTELLEASDAASMPPEIVAFLPDEDLPLDVREVMAFRRLKSPEDCNSEFERFILAAAALRRCIRRLARKIARLRDDEDRPSHQVFQNGVRAMPQAESFLTRYSQAINQAVLDGNVAEAQAIQILRMRLMREFSGLWLQVRRQA